VLQSGCFSSDCSLHRPIETCFRRSFDASTVLGWAILKSIPSLGTDYATNLRSAILGVVASVIGLVEEVISPLLECHPLHQASMARSGNEEDLSAGKEVASLSFLDRRPDLNRVVVVPL